LEIDVSRFRDPVLAAKIGKEISVFSKGRPASFMEVCGTHTVAIARSGIRSMLPENLSLISGPGCPVCVTPQGDIERAIAAAQIPKVILLSFGDMIRVPGRDGSLETVRSSGADVRVVFSPRDAISIAKENPDRPVILVGVGFETTIPAFAATICEAGESGLQNLSVLNSFRLVPPALKLILDAGPAVDGLLLPGHVTAVLGLEPYEILPASGKCAVVAGFEPLDILLALKMLLQQLASGVPQVELAYRRAVRPAGNPEARGFITRVFRPADAAWRGIGSIPDSGLAFRDEFAEFDAAAKHDLKLVEVPEPAGCKCASVLMGHLRPRDCQLFGGKCTVEMPVGPCMVSSEGACAAEYRYGDED